MVCYYIGRGATGGRGAARGTGAPRGRGSRDYFANLDNLSQQAERPRTRSQGFLQGQPSINDWLLSQPQQQDDIQGQTEGGQQTQSDRFSDTGSNRDSLNGQHNMQDLLLEIRRDVKSMNRKFDSLEKSVNDLKRDNKHLKQQNQVITSEINRMKTSFAKLEVRTAEAEKKSENLEAQSRRDNLKFFGFEDDGTETWEQSENKVRGYIRNELHIDDTDIKIERAHRLPSRNSPKPIIVKFSFFKDKDSVLRAYRQKRKDENNDNVNDDNDGNNETVRRIRVTEDFPERVVKARTKLFPFLKSCMDDEVNAYLRYDSLVVDGQSYIYDYELKRPIPSNK